MTLILQEHIKCILPFLQFMGFIIFAGFSCMFRSAAQLFQNGLLWTMKIIKLNS